MATQANKERTPGPTGFAVAALVNGLLLIVFNAHDAWRPLLDGVVTPRFAEALWALNLQAAVQVAGNLYLMVAATLPRRRALGFVFSGLSLLGAVVMLQVFPFDLVRFGAAAVVGARAVLALGVFGAAIGTLVNFVKLFTGGGSHPTPVHP